jgi:type IV secretion system protein VirB3
MATPLFKGLTRPVSLMGLPMTYVVALMMVVVGGFIATLSIIYLVVSAIVGYATLRILAAYDPRIFDVIFTVIRVTPLSSSWFKGKGVIYGA